MSLVSAEKTLKVPKFHMAVTNRVLETKAKTKNFSVFVYFFRFYIADYKILCILYSNHYTLDLGGVFGLPGAPTGGFLSFGFSIWKEHINVSSTLIIAPIHILINQIIGIYITSIIIFTTIVRS